MPIQVIGTEWLSWWRQFYIHRDIQLQKNLILEVQHKLWLYKTCIESHLGYQKHTGLFKCLQKHLLIYRVSIQMVTICINITYTADESMPSTVMVYPTYALHLNVHITDKESWGLKWSSDIIKVTGSGQRAWFKKYC